MYSVDMICSDNPTEEKYVINRKYPASKNKEDEGMIIFNTTKAAS